MTVPCMGVVSCPGLVVEALGGALDVLGLTIKVSLKRANT